MSVEGLDDEAYWRAVVDAVARALSEDLGPDGDLTAALVPETATAHYALRARTHGVLAGRACADEAFRRVGPDLDLTWHMADGDRARTRATPSSTSPDRSGQSSRPSAPR